ncbi:MAG TPA: hypothetical protein VF796_05385 [Humisphaera sp.]
MPTHPSAVASAGRILGVALLAATLHAGGTARADAPPPATSTVPTTRPCLAVLDRFKTGEAIKPVSNWKPDPSEKLPGEGLARHSMLYVGEGLNTIFLITGGKVVWAYDTGKGGELDDVWMMSNGHVLFSRQDYAAEVTPEKKEVWRFDCPPGTEIHSLQPVGLDKVMLVQNAVPNPHVLIVDKKTGRTEADKTLPVKNANPHAPFRRGRLTAQGTFLMAFTSGRTVEYDRDMKEVWTYALPSGWAAVRLRNGNTLLTAERQQLTREVDPQGKTVWEFDLTKDVPAGIDFRQTQSCTRLANGNTIICSRGGPKKGCQLIEVTPDKKVVWVLHDWANLGPATAVQILDDPGTPEAPGESEH